jgi:hypothetical protein
MPVPKLLQRHCITSVRAQAHAQHIVAGVGAMHLPSHTTATSTRRRWDSLGPSASAAHVRATDSNVFGLRSAQLIREKHCRTASAGHTERSHNQSAPPAALDLCAVADATNSKAAISWTASAAAYPQQCKKCNRYFLHCRRLAAAPGAWRCVSGWSRWQLKRSRRDNAR